MITRCQFDRGSRVLVNLYSSIQYKGTVERAFEWIAKDGEHKRRRIVMLDEPLAGFEDTKDQGRRWNVELAQLRSADTSSGEQP